MALFGGGNSRSSAGLFIFSGVMQYVELFTDAAGLTLTKCVDMPYDAGDVGADIFASQDVIENNLRKLRAAVGKKWPSKIYAAIQSKDVLLRTVELPQMDIKDIKGAFRYEFDRFFPIPVEDAVYDVSFVDRPAKDDATLGAIAYCLASAVRRSTVENLMRASWRVGLKLSAVEPSPVSTLRCLMGPVAPMGFNIYALTGITSSIIIASYRDNGIVFRNTAQSFASAEGEEQRIAGFARDLNATVNFSATQMRGFVPDKIYVGGYGASLGEHLRAGIAENTQSPVELVNPWKQWGIRGTPTDTYGFEVALGLALRGTEAI